MKLSVVNSWHLFQLFEARRMLQLCLTSLDDLHSLQQELKMKSYDLSPAYWRERWDHVKKIQVRRLCYCA
jgi:hypothetical protein